MFDGSPGGKKGEGEARPGGPPQFSGGGGVAISNAPMVRSVVLRPCGARETVEWAHEEVSQRLGGSITFVGAVPELHVFAVGLSECGEVNRHCVDERIFLQLPVHGPVVFVATDDDGEPMDVDVEGLASVIAESIG